MKLRSRALTGLRSWRYWHPLTISLAVLVVGFGLTYQISSYFSAQAKSEVVRLFNVEADDAVNKFRRQLNEYVSQLEAIRALYAASDFVDPQEFQAFAETLRFQRVDVGVRALGFIALEANGQSTRIQYIYPENDINLSIKGMDSFKYPERKRAMLRSAQEDIPTLSSPVSLFQDREKVRHSRTGYIFYMPVPFNLASMTQKLPEKQLLGWAYVAFDMSEALSTAATFSPDLLNYQVFDVTAMGQPFQVFGDQGAFYPSRHDNSLLPDAFRTVEVFGRVWTIKTTATPQFINKHLPDTESWIWVVGMLTTVFLSLLSWLAVDRTRALRHIQRINRRLMLSEQRWKFALEGSGDGLWDYDFTTKSCYYSPQWKALLGYEDDELESNVTEWLTRIHPEDKKKAREIFDDYFSGRRPDYVVEHRLMCKDKQWKWILVRGMIVERDADNKPTRMIGTMTDISRMKASEEIIWRQANFDTLTGLPNRRMFFDRLEHEIRRVQRYGKSFALMFVDLDEFKEINDQYGHQTGDQALKEITQRLIKLLRATDIVARLGGDEFTIIMSDIGRRSDVEAVAAKLMLTITEPLQLNGISASVSASIGLVICPDDGVSADDLINKADRAMYRSKQFGKNQWQWFESSLQNKPS